MKLNLDLTHRGKRVIMRAETLLAKELLPLRSTAESLLTHTFSPVENRKKNLWQLHSNLQ